MFLIVGVIAVGVAGVAWVATRDTSTMGGSNQRPPPNVAPEIPPVTAIEPINTNSRSQPVNIGPTAGAPPGKAPNGNDLLNFAGVVGGVLGGAAAFTNTGKALAAPIGIGVSTIAILAGAGASLSVAAIWAVPVVLITTSIISIVDAIARTAQNERWRELVIQVRDLRAAGQVREALAVYERAVGVLVVDESGKKGRSEGEVSEISRKWPQPGDDWYNWQAPNGEPYPGFPGPPAPASPLELRANPSLMPKYLPTVNGQTIDLAALFKAAAGDVAAVRAWGLAKGVEGEIAAWGPATPGVAARPIATMKTGPRSLLGWVEMVDRVRRFEDVRASVAAAIPWLSDGCFPQLVRTPEELAVINFKKAGAVAETERRTAIQTTRLFGAGPAGVAAAAAEKADTASAIGAVKVGGRTVVINAGAVEGRSAPAPAAAAETNSGTRQGTTARTNTASEDGHAGGNTGRWG